MVAVGWRLTGGGLCWGFGRRVTGLWVEDGVVWLIWCSPVAGIGGLLIELVGWCWWRCGAGGVGRWSWWVWSCGLVGGCESLLAERGRGGGSCVGRAGGGLVWV